MVNLQLPGFEVTELLHSGVWSLVVRAVRRADGVPVVVKCSRSTRPSPEQVGRLDRELHMGLRVDSPRVVRPLERCELGGRAALVMQDIGARSLASVDRHGVSVADLLRVGLQLTEAVADLHRAGLIHRDINPSNVVVSGDRLQLIDLGMATALREVVASDAVEGTLRYLAPEQTGRTHRTIDARADLYALGCTLFELFAGRPPFDDVDALDLVHAHLASEPPLLDTLRPEVPRVLGQIVDRLLRKDPEERYQSASGLLSDLNRAAERLTSGPVIAPFELGEADVAEGLRVPQRLYGRADEVERLGRAVASVAAGGVEVIMVSGPSGSGKTSLVRELRRPLTLARGVLLEGKFDAYRMGAPCAPIGAALEQLVHSILASHDEQVEVWKRRVLQAVGMNGRVVTEMVPALERLIGEQPALPELPPAEAENRLFGAFRALVRVLARPERPLALFLDDLQWADLPSLRLLERLATDQQVGHLLLVGAYRDNEVGPAHPLTATVATIRQVHEVEEARAAPLGLGAVRQLLADTLRCPVDTVGPLAEVLHRRTHGNPYFLGRLLDSLVEEGVLARGPSGWSWDLARASVAVRGDDVAELLGQRVVELPDDVRQAVQVAACIGPTFDLRHVAAVLGHSAAALQQTLAPAVALELVRPLGVDWPLIEGQEAPDEAYGYAFVHDRVQQAAYRSADAEVAARYHLVLGNLLDELHESPFSVVHHLNRAVGLLDETARVELARRNLDASRRARQAAAFGSAFELLEAGMACLDEGHWASERRLQLALHLEGAEAAYLSARVERMVELLAAAKQHTVSTLERVATLRIEVDARIARADLLGALSVAHDALEVLGVALPRTPDGDDVGAWVGRAMERMATVDIDELADRSEASDAEVLAGMDMLARMCAPAYYAAPLLLPVVACELVVRSIEHGMAAASSFAFAVYGIVLNSIGQFEAGHAVGHLALARIDAQPAPGLEARVRHVVHNLVCVWTEPFQDHLQPLREVVRLGQDSGDLEYAAIAAHCTVHNALYGGSDLQPLAEEADRYTAFMRNNHQGAMLLAHLPIAQCVHALAGHLPKPGRLDGDGFDEDEVWEQIAASDSRSAVFIFRLQQLTLRLMFGAYDEAWELAQAARPYQDGVPSTYHLPVYHLYACLAGLLGGGASEREAAVAESLDALRGYAAAGPMNHAHRVALVEALAASREEPDEAALRSAVEAAAATRFGHDAALAFELAGAALLRGTATQALLGRAFLSEAHQRFAEWGAVAKVRQLERAYPTYFAPSQQRSLSLSGSTHLDLDAETVMRAASAISAELALERLLPTLLRLSMQSAGARQGMLFLHDDGAWRMAAVARGGQEAVRCDRPMEDLAESEAPLQVLRLVLRTEESLVVDDVEQSMFAGAEGLDGARSFLVVPLHRQGALAAVLYLAHDRATSAFTEGRVGVVRVLAAQAAVALENATLYDNLEAKVRERTAELIVARQRAEVASQAKSDFLGNMSHELRTPLNAVLGYAQIVMRQSHLPTGVSDAVQTIYDSGRHLLALINDVLDMARVEAGRLGLEPVPTDLWALARGVAEVLELQARRGGVRLSCRIEPTVPRWVGVDPRRLRQVLLNLLGNAVKFTERGQVTLRVAAVDDGVRFEVSDTGVGIPADRLQAIFEPFEQEGGADQRAQGTGLGLSITRQLVEAMGGQVEVRSVLGEGSTFHFTVPLPAASPSEGAGRASIEGYEGPRRRVLVVDDSRLNRMVLLDMLEPLGFEVLLATSGDEALQAAAEAGPDLVLMDLVMPGRDGFDTTRILRERQPGLPVVSVSASVGPRVAQDQLFDAALAKPVELDELLALLAEQLELRWVREASSEGSSSPVTADSSPPGEPVAAEVLAAWSELALSGDLAGLATAARSLAEAQPGHAAIAAEVVARAQDFDDEGLLALLAELRR